MNRFRVPCHSTAGAKTVIRDHVMTDHLGCLAGPLRSHFADTVVVHGNVTPFGTVIFPL